MNPSQIFVHHQWLKKSQIQIIDRNRTQREHVHRFSSKHEYEGYWYDTMRPKHIKKINKKAKQYDITKH